MNEAERQTASAARGFMAADEGLALWQAATAAIAGPMLEVGSYCGKSACYIGPAARDKDSVLYCVDHHRGSEENQAGWEHHEPDLVDTNVNKMDTLGIFRRTIHDAGLERWVVAVVGETKAVAPNWQTELGFLFIDGGHGEEPAADDYRFWTPLVRVGGTLAIHDVFPDPADGGRPPFEQIYLPALASGKFVERSDTGSLRILERVA